jgi:RsmE family RNA methyltransferase
MMQALEGAKKGSTLTLVIGPEGGFIQAELDSFQRSGFRFVDLQTGTLKTEAAIACALGQLALVRALLPRAT